MVTWERKGREVQPAYALIGKRHCQHGCGGPDLLVFFFHASRPVKDQEDVSVYLSGLINSTEDLRVRSLRLVEFPTVELPASCSQPTMFQTLGFQIAQCCGPDDLGQLLRLPDIDSGGASNSVRRLTSGGVRYSRPLGVVFVFSYALERVLEHISNRYLPIWKIDYLVFFSGGTAAFAIRVIFGLAATASVGFF